MIEKMKAKAISSEHAGGQGGTEYAILVAILVFILVVGLVIGAQPKMQDLWSNAKTNLDNAVSHGGVAK